MTGDAVSWKSECEISLEEMRAVVEERQPASRQRKSPFPSLNGKLKAVRCAGHAT